MSSKGTHIVHSMAYKENYINILISVNKLKKRGCNCHAQSNSASSTG